MPQQAQSVEDVGGQADSADEREKEVVDIGQKEVIIALVGLTCSFVIGAIAWQYSKYFLLDRRYEKMADKAVEGIKAVGEVIEKIDDSDIDMNQL